MKTEYVIISVNGSIACQKEINVYAKDGYKVISSGFSCETEFNESVWWAYMERDVGYASN